MKLKRRAIARRPWRSLATSDDLQTGFNIHKQDDTHFSFQLWSDEHRYSLQISVDECLELQNELDAFLENVRSRKWDT